MLYFNPSNSYNTTFIYALAVGHHLETYLSFMSGGQQG